jgi:hypothetical protein
MLPLTVLLAFLPGEGQPAPYVAELAAIQAVGKEGSGNDAAAKAWAKLVAAGPPALMPVLGSFEGASPASQNWFRTAAYAIAEAETQAGRKLDAEALTKFTADTQRPPAARRIAFELLKDQDAAAAKALLSKFTNDPSLELRREAIAERIETNSATELRVLFGFARDKDQVEDIAKRLKERKSEVNITKHFGYITQWDVVGPFDNKEGKGYTTAHEPEVAGPAKDSAKAWKPAQSSATYGTIDLNTAIGKHKDAVAYAKAVIVVDADTPAELRVASQNAVKFYVNGAEVFAREEYHHGTRMDQHTASITLKKGENTILLKVCQNDMSYSWAQAWGFAARICDATGGKLLLKQSFHGETIEPGALAPAPAPKKEEK